ncbi:phosphatase [Clostridium celatum]|uniref:phosphatase n=1 Tax=Clostridium celatum TaxID=36834 RepID=UPI0028FE13AD|nr:phosphatase [Clostridium celatum]MDU2265168.1 phosphatase [Clostridium celatum]MDU6295067.1 phosphatase [Clostridium celatum]MDY3359544.1 phosphatase [Clostridium celatum]
MKSYFFRKVNLIFVFILLSTFISANPMNNLFKNNKTLIVLDSASNSGLPDRFRDITNLNISGSSQFTKSQINNLKEAINKPNICIVDLRQESHGMLNDFAISFFSPYTDLNNGLTTEEVIKKENSQLSSIKIGSDVDIYHKTGRLFKEVTAEFVSNEDSIVTNDNMQYKRYAVKDNGSPTPIIVDNFVEFIKNKPTDLHIHFHCDAGEGRTTLFMAMYQTMLNNTNLSLNQIISYQYNIGGVLLTDNKNQLEFLQEFYNYVSENKSTNYEKTYSQWITE